MSAISRAGIYRGLSAGAIKARKAGKSLLIDMASLRAYVESLPVATFKPAPERDAA
jgi:hypothetical protein